MADDDETKIQDITPTEAPFLVGMKGRNISLIRKCSGMLITIRDNVVYMKPQRPTAKPELAQRMVASACSGGILRWFVTQTATQSGYPLEKVDGLETLAQSYQCTLKLLRARCGHMCLMLIPDTVAEHRLAEARVALLAALTA
jgi:hypothetical protein